MLKQDIPKIIQNNSQHLKENQVKVSLVSRLHIHMLGSHSEYLFSIYFSETSDNQYNHVFFSMNNLNFSSIEIHRLNLDTNFKLIYYYISR